MKGKRWCGNKAKWRNKNILCRVAIDAVDRREKSGQISLVYFPSTRKELPRKSDLMSFRVVRLSI